MHQLFFAVRRAFHCSNQMLSRVLQGYGLTPARFDLLFAIKQFVDGLPQSQLRRLFGVSGPTTSKMLCALEARGLVARTRAPRDRRVLHVRLTALGRRIITRAQRLLRDSGAADLAAESCATPRWWNPAVVFEAVDTFDSALRFFRQHLDDRACFFYPWHPDD
jgi:DNA-binding MarR family transcriptional regulator